MKYRKTALVEARVADAPGFIDTKEGRMAYDAGDYIAGPGAAGEFWPVKKAIFEATYEPAALISTPLPAAAAALLADARECPEHGPCGLYEVGADKIDALRVALTAREDAYERAVDALYARGADNEKRAGRASNFTKGAAVVERIETKNGVKLAFASRAAERHGEDGTIPEYVKRAIREYHEAVAQGRKGGELAPEYDALTAAILRFVAERQGEEWAIRVEGCDEEDNTQSLFITLRDAPPSHTLQPNPAEFVFVHVGADGRPVSIEVLLP